MQKKILAVVLAVLMVAAILPFAAFAADDPAITLEVASVEKTLEAGATVEVPVSATASTPQST